jgi:DNA polymerase-3 subunit delta'
MSEWFTQVVGQEVAKQALRRAVEGGRLSGSLLICGPRGTGRALLARELARAINCRQPGAARRPCGECASCRKIAQGISGDCVFLRPTDKPSIGIDQVREMLDELALAPVESGKRVFVIDPASALREDAQNALLKGLEEPPARSLIVLLAEHEGELLSTIASRCLIIRSDELSVEQTAGVLEGLGIEPAEALQRARWSGGSPGEALEDDALDVAELGSRTLEAFASGAALADPMPTIEDLLSFAQGKSGDTTDARRRRISRVLRAIQRAVRDALLQREGAHIPRCSGVADALLARLSDLPRGRLERAAEALVQVEEELARNANTKLVLDGLVLDVGAALAPAC